MCAAFVLVVAAVASLNVALPDLARNTGATQTEFVRAQVEARLAELLDRSA